MKTKTISWLVFIAFVLLAIVYNGGEDPFVSHGPYSFGKSIFWLLFLAFSGYTYHCSSNENLFRTIGTMSRLHWGRQIGIDLYLGLSLFMVLIFFHQESSLVALIWLIPVLAFANLATLLYVALHYDSILTLVLHLE